MTAEFADLSVGSGRSMYKGWNTVIVRTETGAEIVEMAKKGRTIEIQAIPDESLTNLKRASLNKKRNALRRIIDRTGTREDLGYLGISGSLAGRLLS